MKYSDSDDGASEVREPRAIYVPIFDSFFESSIMHEDLPTRFVMLALIRLAWRPRSNGIVDVDAKLFAASINVPFKDVEHAIHRLMQPDENSGSKLQDGRRIVPIDPERPMRGWRLVNWADYKTILHKANDKVRKADERSRDKADNLDKTSVSPTIRDDTIRNETKQGERERFAPPTLAECKTFFEEKKLSGNPEAFFYHYDSVGWRSGRAPLRSWKSSAHGWSNREPSFLAAKPGGKPPARTRQEYELDQEADQIKRNREADARNKRLEDEREAEDAAFLEKNWGTKP